MKKGVAILITLFLGAFGVHRFMAGKIFTGLLWLCTGGLFAIGWIIDIFTVCGGSFTRKNGTPWITQ